MNNLKTIFGVSVIPQSTQLRSALDDIPSTHIEGLFGDLFRPLQRGKQLETFAFMDGKYLVLLDGVQYFSSHTISCDCCLRKVINKTTTYYHQVVAATIVCPGIKQVLPLRCTIRILIFPSFDSLLQFIIDPESRIPP